MTPPDFSDRTKWVSDDDIPLLDEHDITEGGKRVSIDRAYLEKVARKMNRKFARTGDASAIIVGHTSDHPNAYERPVVGYYTDFKVRFRPEI